MRPGRVAGADVAHRYGRICVSERLVPVTVVNWLPLVVRWLPRTCTGAGQVYIICTLVRLAVLARSTGMKSFDKQPVIYDAVGCSPRSAARRGSDSVALAAQSSVKFGPAGNGAGGPDQVRSGS